MSSSLYIPPIASKVDKEQERNTTDTKSMSKFLTEDKGFKIVMSIF